LNRSRYGRRTAAALALLLNSRLVVDQWSWVTTAGAGLLLLALLVLFVAFAARIFRLDPELRALREQHAGRPTQETRFRLIDVAIDAVNENDRRIVQKSHYLNAAVLLALLGLLVVAVRSIYLLQGGYL